MIDSDKLVLFENLIIDFKQLHVDEVDSLEEN